MPRLTYRTHIAAIVTVVLLSSPALAANAVKVDGHVAVKMRDGVLLRADVYRPAMDGRFPVLLERTPYDKRNSAGFAFRAAAEGYVVVIMDVRGRYSSEGEWYPFLHESEDGYDTVEWAAGLPYSNGKVGMFGGSYVGATQMLAAIAKPPHLAGICPVVTASNYHDGWTYQGGAFEQWFNESWTAGLAQDTMNRRVQADTNALKSIWKLPLSSFPLFNLEQLPSTADLAPYFGDWLAHPSYDAYWKRWAIEEHYADITVPVLTTAAWYDIFQGGSLRNYEGTKARGGHLLVTIGGHAGGGRKIGDVDFGAPAAEFDEDDVVLRWYDYLFKGARNEFAGKRVRIFVMGRNQWRDEDDWPLARARETRYYLHSAGHAASLRGDGSLTSSAPAAEPNDRYVYDPANPAPTIGGPLCCDAGHLPPGPKDQRPVEARDDVLVYSTAPFDHDTEVTGPVRLELYAASAAVDTDFTAKLVDVWPNGFAQNLTEGIVRARYRDSQEKPELMNPAQIYRFNIDLWATSNVFLKGHVLRLEVGSSNFPRFDRNLNTGEPAAGGSYITATNLVYHDAAHPSALVVSIVP
jgi:putative CocE/NonD family hydrolase